jgi:hypothetical protein
LVLAGQPRASDFCAKSSFQQYPNRSSKGP